ncbi:MAG: bifunctional hydroxymethylpyrimidine kinase/phosphomethylpyrimidine kinase [Planctomycetota bacterium]|jgi:hydroxymethylpyrimidine kinase/phosphomethylpyrimidine kinase
MKKVLIIGGSDSGGGAGIQTDLKTVTALGVYGTTVITAITSQNTQGVQSVQAVPAASVGEQIDSVMSDIGADAVKTGMLLNYEIAEVVAGKIRDYKLMNLVVDPVLRAKDGSALLAGDAAVNMLVAGLLTQALLVTPNIPEAEVLSGLSIMRPTDIEEAARYIHGLGAKNVLIKGGHAPADWPSRQKGVVEDVFYDGQRFRQLVSPRVDVGAGIHGSGCTLASAIAAGLAHGKTVEEAVLFGKEFMSGAMTRTVRVGRGHCVLDHSGSLTEDGT